MSKKVENFSEDLFGEHTLYIWKYFVLNIRADSSCLLSAPPPPPKKTVLLFYGYGMNK